MLTTELTSRKIYEGMKEAGYECELHVWLETPELASAKIILDGRTWTIDGVPALIDGQRDDVETKEDLLIHFQITKVFEQGDTGQHVVLKRLEELFIQYDLNPTNADGSIPVLVTRKLPLTEGDEINLDTIVNQFNQFQEAVVEVLY